MQDDSHIGFPPWTPDDVIRNEFMLVEQGSQAQITVTDQGLRLELKADPLRSDPVAVRLTDLTGNRRRRWQPVARRPLVLTAQVRFDQAQPPQHVTEAIFLWSGRIPPISVFGVTRAQGRYAAIVAVDFDPQTGAGFLKQAVLPAEIHADDWHTLETVVAVDRATIAVNQRVVLDIALPEPPPLVAVELSIDNDTLEGHLQVLTTDALSVRSLSITQKGA